MVLMLNKLNMYIKLDEILAQMFSYFDKSIGKGKYTLMLTADHGAGTSPDVVKENLMAGILVLESFLLRSINICSKL